MRSKNHPALQPATLRKFAELFHLLAEESRLRLLLVLAAEGELSVTRLAQTVHLAKSTVSYQLECLSLADLVTQRREGRSKLYRTNTRVLRDLVKAFFKEVGCASAPFQFADLALAYQDRRSPA